MKSKVLNHGCCHVCVPLEVNLVMQVFALGVEDEIREGLLVLGVKGSVQLLDHVLGEGRNIAHLSWLSSNLRFWDGGMSNRLFLDFLKVDGLLLWGSSLVVRLLGLLGLPISVLFSLVSDETLWLFEVVPVLNVVFWGVSEIASMSRRSNGLNGDNVVFVIYGALLACSVVVVVSRAHEVLQGILLICSELHGLLVNGGGGSFVDILDAVESLLFLWLSGAGVAGCSGPRRSCTVVLRVELLELSLRFLSLLFWLVRVVLEGVPIGVVGSRTAIVVHVVIVTLMNVRPGAGRLRGHFLGVSLLAELSLQ